MNLNAALVPSDLRAPRPHKQTAISDIQGKIVAAATSELDHTRKEAESNILAAQARLEATTQALDALDREDAVFASRRAADRIDIEAERARLDAWNPTDSGQLARLLQISAGKLLKAWPSTITDALDLLRKQTPRDNGAVDVRLMRLEKFDDAFRLVLAQIRPAESASTHSAEELRVLAGELHEFVKTSWQIDRVNADLGALSLAAAATPLIDTTTRSNIGSGLADGVAAFDQGEIRLAVESVVDLLNVLEDPLNQEIQEQSLAFAEQRIEGRIQETKDSLDKEQRFLRLSMHEQHAIAGDLSRVSNKWDLETAADQAHQLLAALGPSSGTATSYEDALLRSSRALDLIQVLEKRLQQASVWSADDQRTLADAIVAADEAQAYGRFMTRDLSPAGLPNTFPQNVQASGQVADLVPSQPVVRLWSLVGVNAEARAVRLWYGRFSLEVDNAAWEHLRLTLQSTLLLTENALNIDVQAARRERAANHDALSSSLLSVTESNLRDERRKLRAHATKIDGVSLAAKNLLPNVALADAAVPYVEVSPLLQTLQQSCELSPRSDQKAEPFRKAWESLCSNVKGLTPGAFGPNQSLTPQQSSDLKTALLGVSRQFPELVDAAKIFPLGHGNKKAETLDRLDLFAAAVMRLQVRLDGFVCAADECGRAGNSSFQQRQIAGAIASIARTPTRSEQVRSFGRASLRGSSWFDPFLALTVANEVVVFATGGVAPLAYGLTGTEPGIIRTVIYPNPFPIGATFPPDSDPSTYGLRVDEASWVQIPGIWRVSLESINAAILGIGAVGNFRQTISAKRATAGYRLDTAALGLEAASIVSTQAPAKEGVIYLCSRGCLTVLEFSGRQITDLEVQNAKRWRLDNVPVIEGGAFTVVKGNRYLWIGNMPTKHERLAHLGKGSLASLGAAQIVQGLPHDIDNLVQGNTGSELRPFDVNPMYRVLDAAYLASLVINARDVAAAVRYKVVSRTGGFVDGHSPRFIREIECWDSVGKMQTLELSEGGDLYLKRTETDATYLDEMDGTVAWKLNPGKGPSRLLRWTALRTRLQTYVDSRDAVKAGLRSLADSHGRFVPRRKGSAPVLYTHTPSAETLTIQEGLTWAVYDLDPPVWVPFNSKEELVRPYYPHGTSPGAPRGIVVTKGGEIPLRGSTVDGSSVLVYQSSVPEKIVAWNALVSEGTLAELHPVNGAIVLADRLPVGGANLKLRLDGKVESVQNAGVPGVLFSDSPQGLDIFDDRSPDGAVHARVRLEGESYEVGIGMPEVAGLAKTAALEEKGGQWFLVDPNPTMPPASARSFALEGQDETDLYWDEANGAWRVAVRSKGKHFSKPGVYQFEAGKPELESQLAEMHDAFEWEMELPPGITPHFKREIDPATDFVEIRISTNSQSEVRYSFNQYKETNGRAPLTGTFVVRNDTVNGTRVYRVAPSLRGIQYLKHVHATGVPSFWRPIDALRSPVGPDAWFCGTVPGAIQDQFARSELINQDSIEANYAYDALDQRFLLKVDFAEWDGTLHSLIFGSESTVAGYTLLDHGSTPGAEVYSRLPAGIPDELIATLPERLADPASYRKIAATKWEHREASEASMVALQRRLKTGGAIILDPGVDMVAFSNKFAAEGRAIVDGSDGDIPYGGARFRTHVVPLDTEWPDGPAGIVILEATEPSVFLDPQLDAKTAHPVTLEKGQIVIIETSGSKEEIARERQHRTAPEPALRRVLLSILGVANPESVVAKGHLPSSVGAGAEKVDGGLNPDYAFFKAGSNGGKVTDAVTGQEIQIEPGSVWSLGSSPLESQASIRFNDAKVPAWFQSLFGWEQIQQDYRLLTADRGMPRVLELKDENRLSWTDPVTNQPVSGRLATPDKADPGAPSILVLDGPAVINEPVHGKVSVQTGDVLLLRVPLALQEAIATAQSGAAAVLLDAERGKVTPLRGPNFNSTDFSGILEARYLDLAKRGSLKPSLSDKTLVRTDERGNVLGQILPGKELLSWIQRREEKQGFVSVIGAPAEAETDKGIVPLKGLVAIGEDQTHGELPYKYVLDHTKVQLKSDNKLAFFLEIESRGVVGQINFGLAAACDSGADAIKRGEDMLTEAIQGAPYAHEDTLISPVKRRRYTEPDGVLELTRENLRTRQRTIERWRGQVLVTRTWLSQENRNSPLRTTYYMARADHQIPLYTAKGINGAVQERYETHFSGEDLSIATYAADGKDLLKLTDQDKDGHVLRTWNARNHTMEVNWFDPAIREKGTPFNVGNHHDGVTATAWYQVLPTDLNLSVNPASGHIAPMRITHRPSPSPLNEARKKFLAGVIYSPTGGRDMPVAHVVPQGADKKQEQIHWPRSSFGGCYTNENYPDYSTIREPRCSQRTDEENVLLDVVYKPQLYQDGSIVAGYRLLQGRKLDWAQPSARVWNETVYETAPLVEYRDFDLMGRLVSWRLESVRKDGSAILPAIRWLTYHEYEDDDSKVIVHSGTTYNDIRVADTYYPGEQTFDDALANGIKWEHIEDFEKKKGKVWDRFKKEEADLKDRYEKFRSPGGTTIARSGFGTNGFWQELNDAGLTAHTTLEASIRVSYNGGISVDYRLPDDGLERLVMVDHGDTRELTSSWKGGDSRRTLRFTASNAVMGEFEAQADAEAEDALNLYAEAYYDYAASWLGETAAPSGWLQRFWPLRSRPARDTIAKHFKTLGIEQGTTLGVVGSTPRKLGPDANGKPEYKDVQSHDETNYVLPNDPLGNYLIQADNRDSKHFVSHINLWWMQGDETLYGRLKRPAPPMGVSPGSIGIMDSIGGDLGQLMIFAGVDLNDRDQKGNDREQQNKGKARDLTRPQLARLKPTILDADLQRLREGADREQLKQALDDIAWLLCQRVQGYWYAAATEGNYLDREFHARDSGRVFVQQFHQVMAFPMRLFLPAEKRVYLDTRVPWFKPIVATDEEGHILAVWKNVSVGQDEGERQEVQVKRVLGNLWYPTVELTDSNGFPAVRSIDYTRLTGWPYPYGAIVAGAYFVVIPSLLLCGALWAISWHRRKQWNRYKNAELKKSGPGDGGRDGPLYTPEDTRIAIRRIAQKVLTVAADGNQKIPSPLWKSSNRRVFTPNGTPELSFLAYLYPLYASIIAWRRRNGGWPGLFVGTEQDAVLEDFGLFPHDPILEDLDKFSIELGRYFMSESSVGRTRDKARFASDNSGDRAVDPYVWDKLYSYLQAIFLELRKPLSEWGNVATENERNAANERVWLILRRHQMIGKDTPRVLDANKCARAELRDEADAKAGFDGKGRAYSEFLAQAEWEKPGSRWTYSLRQFLGLRTKSIHIYAGQEFADLFPVFLATLTAMGVALTEDLHGVLHAMTVHWLVPVWFAAVTAVGGSIEWTNMSRGGVWKLGLRCRGESALPWFASFASAGLAFAIWALPNSTNTSGTWFLKTVYCSVALVECWGYAAMRHSLIGLSIYHHLKPTIGKTRPRVTAVICLQTLSFLGVGMLIAFLTSGWWFGHYEAQGYWRLRGGLIALLTTLYLIYYGLWSLITSVVSVFWPTRGPMPVSRNVPKGGESASTAGSENTQPSAFPVVVVYAGPTMSSPVFRSRDARMTATRYFAAMTELEAKGFEPLRQYLETLKTVAGKAAPKNDKAWIQLLYKLHKWELWKEVSLLHRNQLRPGLEEEGLGVKVVSANQRINLLLARSLTRFLVLVLGAGGKDSTIDTAINLIELAENVARDPNRRGVCLVIASNKNKDHQDRSDTPSQMQPSQFPLSQDDKIGRLFASLSGQDKRRAYAVTYNWTNVGSKSGNMNGLMLLSNELPGFRVMHVMDRNANVLELETLMQDYDRMLENPALAILTAMRNTSNTIEPIGRQSEAVEGGHGAALLAVPDKIGTGWANLASVDFGAVMTAFSRSDYPVMSFGRQPANSLASEFGLAGFIPNGVGQSEDLWSVFQQTHNLIGLGRDPQFGVTLSSAVKLRERRSSFSVDAAASRWSGGLIDTLRSPIQQRISFFGPESIFERKERRNVERTYLTAPFGVLNIVLLFIGIAWDMNPFVGIQMVFWSVGILFSQALTLHGLSASIRARGHWLSRKFANWLALLTVPAALIVGALQHSFGAGAAVMFLSVVIVLTAHSPAGVAWWLKNRIGDIVLFGPRYFMEAASVFTRLGGGDHAFFQSGGGDEVGGTSGWHRLKQLWSSGWTTFLLASITFVMAAILAAFVPRGAGWLAFCGIAAPLVIVWWRRDRRQRGAAPDWHLVGFALATVLALSALAVCLFSLDAGNILLMGIILAFVSGGVIGLFSEDKRPGEHRSVWDSLSTAGGVLWGIAAVVLLHLWFSSFPGPSAGFGMASRFLLLAPIVTYFAGPLAGGTSRLGEKFLSGPWTRLISNWRRTALKGVALLGWLAIVPVPDNLRSASLPGLFFVGTLEQLFRVLSIAALGIAAILIGGALHANHQRRCLWNQFQRVAPDRIKEELRPTPFDDENELRITRNGALIMQFLVKMGTGHWGDARRALKDIKP